MDICRRAQNRTITGYVERHHIVPKALGGDNTAENLCRLTAREHLIAHLCLIRCTTGVERRKMVYAAWFLTNKIPRYRRGRSYAALKESHANNVGANWRGRKHSEKSKALMRAAQLGRTRSVEAKAKMSAAKKGRKLTADQLANRSGPKHWNFGKHHSEATKRKMRAAAQRRAKNRSS